MSSADYGNNLLDAIELIVDDKVSNAKFNKTIQAVIIEKTDANLGKYKAKYQDSEIDVYSSNPDTTYSTGSLVYVTVPNGDFKQDKVILSAVQKENVEREIVLEQEDEYKVSGGNVVNSTQTYGLCSYKENSKTILYDRDRSVNDINLNVIGLKENIKTNPYLIIAAEFRTELDKGQQSQGNYGIVYDIDFKDNATGKTVTKSYILDIDKMKGTPYNLASFVRQYGIFKIDNENFISVKQVYLFAKDFPLTEEGHSNDIFAQNFELSTADKIKDLSVENYDLSLTKSGKGYFDVKDSDLATINITAKLTFKNKETTQGIEYYWFIEDNTVDTTSTDYLSYGGKGWACVNNYNIVDGSASQKMFIASNNYKTVVKAEVPTSRKVIKCVCVKNGMILAKGYCEIYNYDADYDLEIISDSGTKFYYDNGTPTLTCLVDGEESNSYTYKWSYTDNNDTTILLEETTQDNETYNNNLHAYETLLTKIERGIVMPAASQEELDEYKTIIDSFDDIQRVEGNKVINIDLSKVMDYGTFKCSIYDTNDNLVGTAAILITNEFTIEGNYDLIINSGLQTYIYNRMGVAPTSDSLDNPIKLQPLTFTIVDSKGNALGQKILEQCEIKWTPPKNNSLIEIGIEQSLNELTLPYSIAEKYNKTKAENNKIGLSVKYKDLNLSTETAFTFVKEGDPGVNGNDVVCKIVPNLSDEDLKAFKEYPMIMNGTLNYTPAESGGKWFRVQIWESGIKVWDKSTGDSNVNLTWSILKNTYDSTHSDSSSISVTNGAFNYEGYQEFGADIVKASIVYRDKNYYCNIPIIVGECTDNDYEIKLKKDTGFNTVQYASDGTSPQYDNINPFTIQVLRMINGYQEDVSNTPSAIYKVSYDWGVRGRWYKDYGNDAEWKPVYYLINTENPELAGNQKIYKPIDKYDGKVVNNALEVKILNANNNEIGKLHIPIYFFLNKEGIDSIKGWDGNSISLNEQYGSILAPQVGAGEKDSNNRFTGMLMGKVKEVGKEEEEGLFGYVGGERSIFLNAKTGDASFGKQGEGQIVISPSTGGKIYGGNYNLQEQTGTGMMIDLSSNPEIRWGNQNFSVNSNGELTCKLANINGGVIDGSKGLLTNFIFNGIGYNASFAGVIGYTPMGTNWYYTGETIGEGEWKSWNDLIWIDFTIPSNFTIKKVVVHVGHCSMKWLGDGPRDTPRIQVQISNKNPNIMWDVNIYNDMPVPTMDGITYSRITNLFNVNSQWVTEWNPHGSERITTKDIKDWCSQPGDYRIKIDSAEIKDQAHEYDRGGAVWGYVEVIGWTSFNDN